MEPLNKTYRRSKATRGGTKRHAQLAAARLAKTKTPNQVQDASGSGPRPRSGAGRGKRTSARAQTSVPSTSTADSQEPPAKTRKVTASERKLNYFKPQPDEESEVSDLEAASTASDREADDTQSDLESIVSDAGIGEDLDPHGYKLVRNDVWERLVVNLKCPTCGKQQLKFAEKNSKGFACKVQLICGGCGQVVSQSYTSPQMLHHRGKPFEINKKLVHAFLTNGSGHSGMERLAIAVNMKCMSRKTYSKFVKLLAEESSEFIDDVLLLTKHCVREAHIKFNPDLSEESVLEITVSFDGSWHKRGFTSPYGIGLVIDVLTGLVVDFDVVCKECSVCNQKESQLDKQEFEVWQKTHKDTNQCDKNYSGSSKMMETALAEILWRRSEERGFRYTGLLSDGDANSFAHLQSLNLYPITKEECINHVGERLVDGLKTVVDTCKARKITLGGQKAGESKMKILQSYYREAFKKNTPNVPNMKTAIMASPYHCMSTDKKPQHKFCPGGENSWCFYNKALAMGVKPPAHDKSISCPLRPDVVKHILPVYERLTNNTLLQRCVNLGTQNPNESIHSAIWSKAPKTKATNLNKVKIAVSTTVAEFNMGCEAAMKLRANVTGETFGNASRRLSHQRDFERVKKSIAKASGKCRTVRKATKVKKQAAEKKLLSKEGLTYKAGGFL